MDTNCTKEANMGIVIYLMQKQAVIITQESTLIFKQ